MQLARTMLLLQLYLVCLVSLVDADSHGDQLKDLTTAFWDFRMKSTPSTGTFYGDYSFNDNLRNYTLEQFDADKAQTEAFTQQLRSIPRDKLSLDDQLTYDVLMKNFETFLDGYKWRKYGALNPVNFLEGPYLHWGVLLGSTPFKNVKDYEDFLKRLQALARQGDQVIELMREAIRLNRTNHRVSMEKVPHSIRTTITDVPVANSTFFKPFGSKLDSLGNIADATKSRLRQEAENIISTMVVPAYRRLSEFITQEYMPKTRPGYGVGSWDNGSEYYKAALKFFTTTDLTPEEVHETGLREVDRILALINKIFEEKGFHGTIPEYVASLKQRPGAYFNSSEEIFAFVEDIVRNRIYPKLSKIFKMDPGIKMEIRRMPGNGPAAYYFSGNDAGNPGIYMVNVFNPNTKLKLGYMALSLHESNPGHHWQASYTLMANKNLPKFRRYSAYDLYSRGPSNFPFFTSYSEGWGLYAEYLGEEMGAYKDDDEMFGRYTYEIWRAMRMVVDTGIHVKGWSRDRAIQYLTNYTEMSSELVATEIDRYITWPGQACAYKVGEMKLKELRERAEKELGSNFDVKEYHHIVLSLGGVPLNLLEQQIDQWISTTKGALSGADKMSPTGGHGACLLTAVVLLVSIF